MYSSKYTFHMTPSTIINSAKLEHVGFKIKNYLAENGKSLSAGKRDVFPQPNLKGQVFTRMH